ncbi:conjugal transfer protein TraF (plasmid) [Sinorhizobium meliloti]|nr:conjugal transfer protein TraF [Sinorhizobium meliloti]
MPSCFCWWQHHPCRQCCAAIIGRLPINLTASEPFASGASRRSIDGVDSDLSSFVLRKRRHARARARGYLRFGTCRRGRPLIKTVIGFPGSMSNRCGRHRSTACDPFSDLAQRDGEGRPMVPYSGGVVPAESVFLHSPFRSSYDSRYFGPLPVAGILGLAQPVLTNAL